MSMALPADAYRPVLHEYIPPDDGEDLSLSTTTAEGDLPAAIETRSGVVRAPETQRPPSPAESAYREPLSSSLPNVYRPDRDTRRPSIVRYDDPFTPSIAPYKRLRAFDSVGPDYGLRVRDTTLSRVPAGGSPRAGEDEFYADLTIDLTDSNAVLIPSVGPDARVLAEHATPSVPIEIWRDGAENWYAKATENPRTRVHLVMQVAVPRAAFGGQLEMPPWSALGAMPALPSNVARAVGKVGESIGLSRSMSPQEVVETMVAYFRAFTPSDDPPKPTDDIYLDLALSKKGVCRHRAFAFLVTALGMGIPTRMVTNEAHAWVEVRAAHGFQRIDLGGAAGAIDAGASETRATYDMPADPLAWPSDVETGSGEEMARRGRASRSPGSGVASSAESSEASQAPSSSSSRQDSSNGAPSSAPEKEAADGRPASRVTLRGADVAVRRGAPLHVAGRVEAERTGCGKLRVDISLESRSGRTMVGALTTDDDGAFDGNLYLPLVFPVGDYELSAHTPGDARCGEGSSGASEQRAKQSGK